MGNFQKIKKAVVDSINKVATEDAENYAWLSERVWFQQTDTEHPYASFDKSLPYTPEELAERIAKRFPNVDTEKIYVWIPPGENVITLDVAGGATLGKAYASYDAGLVKTAIIKAIEAEGLNDRKWCVRSSAAGAWFDKNPLTLYRMAWRIAHRYGDAPGMEDFTCVLNKDHNAYLVNEYGKTYAKSYGEENVENETYGMTKKQEAIQKDVLRAIEESGFDCNSWKLRKSALSMKVDDAVCTDLAIAFKVADRFSDEPDMNNFSVWKSTDENCLFLVNRVGKFFAIGDIRGQEAPEEDLVNHPKHYAEQAVSVEPIDVLQFAPFDLGNTLKYVIRSKHKGNELQDLEKALFYVGCADKNIFASKNGDGRYLRYLSEFLSQYGHVIERFEGCDTCNGFTFGASEFVLRLKKKILDRIDTLESK